ncbi:MAG: DNA repair exonuclease [Firmicutes bacterium]|nr:DNA repair exonuclease [Bacillota bacterium]
MTIKVFHTGDLHLGMQFANRGYSAEIRQELIEARFRVLEHMVSKANEEKCHLFVVAGDLFERPRLKEEQILRTAEILSDFSGVCAVLPGNHDYYHPGSFLWEKFNTYAADNIILLYVKKPYSLSDYGLDVVLYPAPCQAKHSPENSLEWIFTLPEKPPARWHLGIAHGAVEGYSPDFDRQYYPMQENELLATGLDFWFLGHTHVRVPAAAEFVNTPFAYCGTPEPDGFDCRHEGSAWLVKLGEDGNVTGKAINTGIYRFLDLERTINSAEEFAEVMQELTEAGESTLVRVKLQGILNREDFENRLQWRDRLQEKLFYLEWDDTNLQLEISPETIAELFPEGSFPYLFLERLVKRKDKKALQMAYSLLQEVKK